MNLSNFLGSLVFSCAEIKPLMGLNDSISYVSGQFVLIDPIVLRINLLFLPYFQLLVVKIPISS